MNTGRLKSVWFAITVQHATIADALVLWCAAVWLATLQAGQDFLVCIIWKASTQMNPSLAMGSLKQVPLPLP